MFAYLVCVLFCIERSATQPVSPQMFHASRKREGGRVDGGRGGVLQETPAARLQHDWVRWPPCPHPKKKPLYYRYLYISLLFRYYHPPISNEYKDFLHRLYPNMTRVFYYISSIYYIYGYYRHIFIYTIL